jgi:transketolase
MLWESQKPKVAILATGALSYNALVAARALEEEGVGTIVLHNPSVKPLDEAGILALAKRVHAVVTVEEHQAAGGFGSAVCELLAEHHPMPIERLGIRDQFGQSGTPDELIEHYGLGVAHIKEAARQLAGAHY